MNTLIHSRILIFQCTETMRTVARKSRIVKQLGSTIHSILSVELDELVHRLTENLLSRYTDNKVFVALNHGELCVFHRDMSKVSRANERRCACAISDGQWDLDCPIIQSIEEDSDRRASTNVETDDGENCDPISVMALAAGKL
jgi:hypothetical protein